MQERVNGTPAQGTQTTTDAAQQQGAGLRGMGFQEQQDAVSPEVQAAVSSGDPRGKISGLHPALQAKARQLLVEANRRGLRVQIFEGMRSIARQNDLYAQGRTKPGNIVTSVRGGRSYHNYGLAIDVVFQGAEPWGEQHDWTSLGEAGEAAGLQWGGRWTRFNDRPHFQMPGLSVSQLQAWMAEGGMDRVWSQVSGGQTAENESPAAEEPGVDAGAGAGAGGATTSYTVKRGDTLAAIASRVMGDSSRWREIASANGISNPRALRVGQQLVIPGQATAAAESETTTEAETDTGTTDEPAAGGNVDPTADPAAASATYTVQRGDTLGAIAANLLGSASQWRDIASANGISDPRALRVGQVLQIPGVSATSGQPSQESEPTSEPASDQDPTSEPTGGGGEVSAAERQRLAFQITEVMETGGLGRYATINDYDNGIISYGVHQATLASGNLELVLERYLASSQTSVANDLRAYMGRVGSRDASLRGDATFKSLLRQAATEPEMQAAQDAGIAASHYQPAVRRAEGYNIQSPLGQAMLFDTNIQGGLSSCLSTAESTVGGKPGDGGITELAFLQAFNDARRARLISLSQNPNRSAATRNALRNSTYRCDEFDALLAAGNLELTGDFSVRGVELDGAETEAAPTTEDAETETDAGQTTDDAAAREEADPVRQDAEPEGELTAGGGESAPTQEGFPKSVTITASALRVRSSAEIADDNIVTTLRRGTSVEVTGTSGDFYQFNHQGQTAFMSNSAQYSRDADAAARQPNGGAVELSGPSWHAHYMRSVSIDDLSSRFKPKVLEFKAALESAATPANNLNFSIATTYRPQERAVLMRCSWMVSNGTMTPQAANSLCAEYDIPINWDHGSISASRAAARALKNRYNMAANAAIRTGRHMTGDAIDWHITWNGSLNVAERGSSQTLDCTGSSYSSGYLRRVGRSYGVIALGDADKPHWSIDGR